MLHRGHERREHPDRALTADVLPREAVRLDQREHELRVRVRQWPRSRAISGAEDLRARLVVDVEGDVLRGPRRAIRRARGLRDVEMDDRGADHRQQVSRTHAVADLAQAREAGRRQPGGLEAAEVALLEAAQLAAEQAARDVVEQRTIRAGVVLDQDRRGRRQCARLGKRGGHRIRDRSRRAQAIEQRREQRRVREHGDAQRRGRQPRRDLVGRDAASEAMERVE